MSIPVLFVAEPVFLLLSRGQWKSLLVHMQGLDRKGRGVSRAVLECLNLFSREWVGLEVQSSGRFTTQQFPPFTGPASPHFDLGVCDVHHAGASQTSSANHRSVESQVGQERHLQLEAAIQGLDALADGLCAKKAGSHISQRATDAGRIIEDFRAVRFLRNRADLKNMKGAIIRALMPRQLQNLAKLMMYDPLAASTLSTYQARSQTKRNLLFCIGCLSALRQVHIDGAFCMLMREVLGSDAAPGPAIFLCSDSSPQGQVDRLMSVFDYIPMADPVPCLQNTRALFASSSELRNAVLREEDWSLDVASDIVLRRVEAAKFLKERIHQHRQVPIGLGSGATSLEHKCAALALKFSYECSSFSALRQVSSTSCQSYS